MFGEVAQQTAGIGLAEQRRRLAHRDRAEAEGFDREPEGGQFLATRQELLDRGLVHFDDLRDQQDLPLHAVFGQRSLQPFVDDALMRGVLVNDNKTVAGLRDDIGLVNLRSRRAKWPVEQVGGWLCLEANVCRRRADIEGRLARLGKGGGCGGLKSWRRSGRKGRRTSPVPICLSPIRLLSIRLSWRK